MPVLITYGSYAFTTTGRAQYARKDTYEADAAGGRPHRRKTTWTIAQIFKEPSYADNAARYTALLTALKTTEQVLAIVDENGTTVASLRARPVDGDWPEQWGQHLAEVKVSFLTSEDLSATSDPFTATYTPMGGSAVTLANVTGFRTDLKTSRPSTAVFHRRETNCTATVQGKIRADPQATASVRRAWLLAQRAVIEGLDSMDGVLVFADFNSTVQVDAAAADIKDATDELEYTVSFSYRKFPSGDYAECEYSFAQSDDHVAHERTTTVRGKVRADDEAGAKAKADAMRDLAVATGRVLRKSEWDAQRLDGGDGTAFTEGCFTYDFRETLAGAASYKLSIASKDDLRSGAILISYSGTATAADSASALTAARAAGDGKHDIRLTSSETVETFSVEGSAAQFVQVTFAYEYLTKGTLYFAEVTSDLNRPTFGSAMQTVQGTATADTAAHAATLAQSFKPGGLLQRDAKESTETVYRGTGTGQVSQFSKVSFSYSFHLAAVSGSIQYAKKTAENIEAREITTSWTGSAWAADEASADALITALLSGATGRTGADERTSNWDKGASTVFVSRSFSLSRIVPMAAGDDDILAAECSLESTYSVDHAVITPIPFGTPHVQTGCGITPGLIVVTGSVTALTAASAQTWGRAKEPGTGYPDPQREKLGTVFYPMTGTSVKAYRFDFTYSARFPDLVR